MTSITVYRVADDAWCVVRLETENFVIESAEWWCTWRGNPAMRRPDCWQYPSDGYDWIASAWHPVRYPSRAAAIAQAGRLRTRGVMALERRLPR